MNELPFLCTCKPDDVNMDDRIPILRSLLKTHGLNELLMGIAWSGYMVEIAADQWFGVSLVRNDERSHYICGDEADLMIAALYEAVVDKDVFDK